LIQQLKNSLCRTVVEIAEQHWTWDFCHQV